ncbi:hypothetical protein LSAT2_013853, partial [Lamellibrachia satsuma]
MTLLIGKRHTSSHISQMGLEQYVMNSTSLVKLSTGKAWGDLDSHDWNQKLSTFQPNQTLDRFFAICANTSLKYVPRRKKCKKGSKIPRTRRIMMRCRTKVNKQLFCVTLESRKAKLT